MTSSDAAMILGFATAILLFVLVDTFAPWLLP